MIGTALLQHPDSEALRQKLSNGELDTAGYYRQLLRVIYRLLFLMVAEERSLIFPEEATASLERRVYRDYYSVGKLRNRAERYFRGDGHCDLWLGLRETFRLFRDSDTARKLGVSALDAELFGPDACRDLEEANCRNEQLLDAVRHLSTFLDDGGNGTGRTRRSRGPSVRRRVNYAQLNVEELGSIYESLLDFHPRVSMGTQSFELVSGSERKETGSYYTPPELVRELINSALIPVIEDRLKGLKSQGERESALLGIKVCDPACGSGHFLLAAARRIARELAQVRTGEPEPAPTAYRLALRDVIRNCVYAVDKNPLAVDLCKVALWIEGHNSGLPLSFLDHHVRCGDSLVGVFDLEVLAHGIPDDAYKPVTGDDRTVARAYVQKNRRERAGQFSLGGEVMGTHAALAGDFRTLAELVELTPEDVQSKESIYVSLREKGTHWWNLKVACDLWTSAFLLPMVQDNAPLLESVPTTDTIRGYMARPIAAISHLVDQSVAISQDQAFFHWPLEFPEVFASGGFDCVIGNPPWEKVQPEERQFFLVIRPDIALAIGAERKRMVSALEHHDHGLWSKWNEYRAKFDRFSNFIRTSGRYRLSAVGNLNTSTLFVELSADTTNSAGRMGMFVPSGIATNEITSEFFQSLVRDGKIRCLYDFENGQSMFPDVHSSFRFCLIVIGESKSANQGADFSFFRRSTSELADPMNHFTLDIPDFELLSPNTGTCPTFTSAADAELTKAVYRRIPVFIREKPSEVNPWRTRIYAEMYNMTRASHLFHTTEALIESGAQKERTVLCVGSDVFLPVYEARMLGHYDHRLCSIGVNPHNVFRGAVSETTTMDEHVSPDHFVAPRYWLNSDEFQNETLQGYHKEWFSGFRMVTAATNERTMIASVFPRTPFVNTISGLFNDLPAEDNALLVANLSAFVLDYIARQRISGVSLNFFVAKQLPIIPPDSYPNKAFIALRVLELTYTAWDLRSFAQDCGWPGPPFRWDEVRRFLLRCELDATFFHLYGIDRDDVGYIMDTFPIVKRKDEQAHGEYRTKRIILEIYDEMARAIESGQPYQTRLDPPPADPRAAHIVAT